MSRKERRHSSNRAHEIHCNFGRVGPTDLAPSSMEFPISVQNTPENRQYIAGPERRTLKVPFGFSRYAITLGPMNRYWRFLRAPVSVSVVSISRFSGRL